MNNLYGDLEGKMYTFTLLASISRHSRPYHLIHFLT